jgi:hypothetical protein
MNEELKRTNPEMNYADRLQIISARWKEKKEQQNGTPTDEDRITGLLSQLQEQHLRKEPTEEMIEEILIPILKIKGKEFDHFIRAMDWVHFGKLLTIVIGQPDRKLACRFIKRVLPIKDIHTYVVFYHETTMEVKGVDLLFWCLYNLMDGQCMIQLLDDLVSVVFKQALAAFPIYQRMGMGMLYSMEEMVDMKNGEQLSSSMLVGRHLKRIPLNTLEKLIRQMSTRAMFVHSPTETSFSVSFWKAISNFSFVFSLITYSKILHHLLLEDRFIASPVTFKLLSILGEEGDRIASGVFVAKPDNKLTLGEQYCIYIMNKYGEENFFDVIEQTAFSLCFPKVDVVNGSIKDTVMASIQQSKDVYATTLRKSMTITEDYFDRKINDVFFSTQEEIQREDLCFQTADNCLFGLDELPYLKKKGVNPFTNTSLTEEDIKRIEQVVQNQRSILELVTESSSAFCDLRLTSQHRNSHLDAMMNKSIFLGYATKFSVALDKIFTSNIVLSSVMMYMYEPHLLHPRSEMTDYRQGFQPLGRFMGVQDDIIVGKLWCKVSDTTLSYDERRKNFTWILIFIMEMYGQVAVNLFAYVVENFVACLP